MLERAGDFSESIFTHPVDPYTGLPFENDRIPSERVSASGRSIAALYPLPNRSVPEQNHVSSPVLHDRDDRFDVRFDRAFGIKSRLIARYSFADRDLYEPFSGPGFARVPGFGTNIPRRAQNAMLGEDHTFSAALINQARFSYNRVAAGSYQEQRGDSLNRMVGLPELSSNPRDSGLSFITVSYYSPVGDEYNNPQHSVTNVVQAADTVTYARGEHLISFGGDFRALQQNAFRDVFPRADVVRDNRVLKAMLAAILAHLDGDVKHLDLPVDVAATSFQWRVWRTLQQIPYGETRSYAQVARPWDSRRPFAL